MLKFALAMIDVSQSMEWAKYNIRVNSVSPGLVKTAMTASCSQTLFKKSRADSSL